MRNLVQLLIVVLFAFVANEVVAQIQYTRSYDKTGINVFEPSKKEENTYDGFKIRIGGSFTQGFQSFTVKNKANYVPITSTNKANKNILFGAITNSKAADFDTLSSNLTGFNLAMANLNFDIQIGDGIRVFLENYMSARHHPEFWVKGGYIQIDKLPMFNNPEWFTKYLRVKIGHFQPNYGDFQHRRSDGGNTIFNPFTENLILDAFTTEIGGELYVFPVDNLMVMVGMTSGFINGNIVDYSEAINAGGVVQTKKNPSIFAKVAYDKTSENLRWRLSASIYNNSNIQRNTLFAGDRTGSNWFSVMEPSLVVDGTSTSRTFGQAISSNATNQFTSGRIDPGVANRVTAINFSPFVKWKGLEIQGGVDLISGSAYSDTLTTSGTKEWTRRDWTQFYGEVVYRFLKDEQLFVGARYVNATGQPNGLRYGANDTGKVIGEQAEVGINRLSFSAGYFPTKNMLLKVEYTQQQYVDFPWADLRNEGEFSGFMVQAVIGF